MKWFKNMNIGKKLIISFIFVAIIAGIIGLVGYNSIDEIGNVRLPSVHYLLEIEKYMTDIGSDQNRLIDQELSFEDRQKVYQNLEENIKMVKEYSEKFLELPWTKEEENIWSDYATEYEKYLESYEEFIALSKDFDDLGIDNPNEVQLSISQRETDHVNWIWQLQTAILKDDKFEGQLDPNECALGKWLGSYESRNQEFNQLLRNIEESHKKVHQGGETIVSLLNSNDPDRLVKAQQLYDEEVLPNMNSVLNDLSKMSVIAIDAHHIFEDMNSVLNDSLRPQLDNSINLLEKLVNINTEIANNEVTNSIYFMLALIIAGVIISIVFGIIISNMIKKPINQGVDYAKKIANGNFDIENINIKSKDEVGTLAKALNQMRKKLNATLSEVQNVGMNVSNGSDEISQGNQDLSQRTQEQASSLEELSATIEEITSSIQ
ncbi:MAG: methyl-accepting chemotaxis protein, partial [Bacillota bacterium]